MKTAMRKGCLASVFFLLALFNVPAFAAKKNSYIVYMGSHPHGRDASAEVLEKATHNQHAFLDSFLGSREKAKEAIIYSYNKHINGFAAHLEEEQAAEIASSSMWFNVAEHPDVITVFPNQRHKLHTTRSWSFMALEDRYGHIFPNSAWNKAKLGQHSIISTIDTGVWPESMSFNDNGFGPVPSRWRGYCQNDTFNGVACNRKLIGAKYFSRGYEFNEGPFSPRMRTPRDQDGHGTHTLSTAGGNFVQGASLFGMAEGTAKGGAPWARVASYKACWPPRKNGWCYDADMMAAFDEAIYDGVDVISVSIGKPAGRYFEDSLSIGSFHAVKNGIVVVCSAGNTGPAHGSVENVSPWVITVGAGTLDREFEASVELETWDGNMYFRGLSLSEPMPEKKFYHLITGEQARAANAFSYDARVCMRGSLNPRKVRGKILVCVTGQVNRMDQGEEAASAGAAGMILCNDRFSWNNIEAQPHVLPAVHITYNDGSAVFNYIYNTRNPRAYITNPTAVKTRQAPLVAGFSSRGPNSINPEIIKPDIVAPGVNIIAAYSEGATMTGLPYDDRRVKFNIYSGTSMACPHVSGAAGLLKTMYPDWSPAAIKSAIMTSANTVDTMDNPILDGYSYQHATPFQYGAGHLYPNRAVDPGLVYDMSTKDYLNFLCAVGYNENMLMTFNEAPFRCPDSISLLDINYPSISVPDLSSGSITISRRLKNIGPPGVYSARVDPPPGVFVCVEPSTLTFRRVGEEKEFRMTLEAHRVAGYGYYFGRLEWTDGRHIVGSPIAVGFPG